jgi:hypothetical protein
MVSGHSYRSTAKTISQIATEKAAATLNRAAADNRSSETPAETAGTGAWWCG